MGAHEKYRKSWVLGTVLNFGFCLFTNWHEDCLCLYFVYKHIISRYTFSKQDWIILARLSSVEGIFGGHAEPFRQFLVRPVRPTAIGKNLELVFNLRAGMMAVSVEENSETNMIIFRDVVAAKSFYSLFCLL